MTVESPEADPSVVDAENTQNTSEEKGQYVFRLRGHFFEVIFEDYEAVQLKNHLGFRCIAYLLGRPNREISVRTVRADLKGEVEAAADDVKFEKKRAHADGLTVDVSRFADLTADRKSLAQVRKHRKAIERELENASGVEKLELQNQAETLDQWLGQTGLGGQSRPADRVESDRKAMSRAYHNCLQELEEVGHTALLHHLKSTMRVGVFCSYAPDKTPPWEL